MEAKEETTSSSSSSSSGFVWIIVVVVVLLAGYASMNVTKTASHPSPQSAQSAPGPAAGDHSIYGPPTISASQINTILAAYHSPAAGLGQVLYDDGVKYGIDPVYALAFFMHESTLGTAGEATATLALGNERCISDRPCIDQDRGGYAQFYSWQDGFDHWYQLVSGSLYKGAGLTTVEQIIPRYAPAADNNDEQAYIASILYCVQSWRAGKVRI